MNKRRVLVTGSASGIGKGIAEKFLSNGANVILLDKNEVKLFETCAEFEKLSGTAVPIVCDLQKQKELQTTVDQAWEYWDGLDVLINNAGLAYREPFVDISLNNWDQIINVNLRATFLLSQIITNQMIKNNIPGAIVNISSKNGLAGSSKLVHYNVSKAGINMLTQSMAVEVAAHNIRVNAVAPGFIETPLDQKLKQSESGLDLTERTPMNRLGTVQEVANGVYFLASNEASYITGTTLVIDGGHLANASEF